MRTASVVVIGLLSFGAGTLVLPIIQRARQFHLEHQGMCKYMQIGLAMGNLHDEHGHFPQGTVPNPNLPAERRLSWFVQLLPYIAQESLYSRINISGAWDVPENEPAVRTAIATFLCDANPNQPTPGQPAPTHYVGLAGIGADAAEFPLENRCAGMFGNDRVICIRDVRDGTSNTIWGIGTASQNGPWSAGGFPTVRPVIPSMRPYLGRNRPFGGVHHDYVRVGRVDGSARTIDECIDPRVFESMVTIGGGEELDYDW